MNAINLLRGFSWHPLIVVIPHKKNDEVRATQVASELVLPSHEGYIPIAARTFDRCCGTRSEIMGEVGLVIM